MPTEPPPNLPPEWRDAWKSLVRDLAAAETARLAAEATFEDCAKVMQENDRLRTARLDAERRLKESARMLKYYGDHNLDCQSVAHDYDEEPLCTCGYDEALAALAETEGAKP